MFYGGKQMRVGCGAICLIALFSDQESNQEKGASKQLAPHYVVRYFMAFSLQKPKVWRELFTRACWAFAKKARVNNSRHSHIIVTALPARRFNFR
jgi:hypothetical protein